MFMFPLFHVRANGDERGRGDCGAAAAYCRPARGAQSPRLESSTSRGEHGSVTGNRWKLQNGVPGSTRALKFGRRQREPRSGRLRPDRGCRCHSPYFKLASFLRTPVRSFDRSCNAASVRPCSSMIRAWRSSAARWSARSCRSSTIAASLLVVVCANVKQGNTNMIAAARTPSRT